MARARSISPSFLAAFFGGKESYEKAVAEAQSRLRREVANLTKHLEETKHNLLSLSGLIPAKSTGEKAPTKIVKLPTEHAAKSGKTLLKKKTKKKSKTVSPTNNMSPEARAARRAKVIDVVRKMPEAKAGNLTVAQVTKACKAAGVNLGVKDSVYATAIANIMFWADKDFKRISSGVYKFTKR